MKRRSYTNVFTIADPAAYQKVFDGNMVSKDAISKGCTITSIHASTTTTAIIGVGTAIDATTQVGAATSKLLSLNDVRINLDAISGVGLYVIGTAADKVAVTISYELE